MPTLVSDAKTSTQHDMCRVVLGDCRERLVDHEIYGLVDSPDRLCRFMESHIWAVWDFQSLLKAMQQHLTCVSVPWTPTPDREARRLVNEIVLDEESDVLPDGSYASHLELYLESMAAAGANTQPISNMLAQSASGSSISGILSQPDIPIAARHFMETSFSIIQSGSAHQVAAAFTYGREDVIPDMFRQLVKHLASHDPSRWQLFRYYLERHIAHDDEHHGPMCRRIVARLCGHDPQKWDEASGAARQAIAARIALWDALAEALRNV